LLANDTTFKWTSERHDAFESLKEKLITAPILAFPDMNKPCILTCDASKSAIGYILSQLGDDNDDL
jgi:poly(3-hydroxyalkanoate) synthetase